MGEGGEQRPDRVKLIPRLLLFEVLPQGDTQTSARGGPLFTAMIGTTLVPVCWRTHRACSVAPRSHSATPYATRLEPPLLQAR